MNDDKQTNGPIMNGDDELAKALTGGLKFEETPPASDDPKPADSAVPTLTDMPVPDDAAKTAEPADEPEEAPTEAPATAGSSDLDQIKTSALDDLKPLVGKLNLSPEEKFDTLLLIIRSTDDQSLIAEAHEAAKSISDDTKRAEALLDIIKEVDYFKNKN